MSAEEEDCVEMFHLGRISGLESFYFQKSISWRDLPKVKLPRELFDSSNKRKGQWVIQQMQIVIDILRVKDFLDAKLSVPILEELEDYIARSQMHVADKISMYEKLREEHEQGASTVEIMLDDFESRIRSVQLSGKSDVEIRQSVDRLKLEMRATRRQWLDKDTSVLNKINQMVTIKDKAKSIAKRYYESDCDAVCNLENALVVCDNYLSELLEQVPSVRAQCGLSCRSANDIIPVYGRLVQEFGTVAVSSIELTKTITRVPGLKMVEVFCRDNTEKALFSNNNSPLAARNMAMDKCKLGTVVVSPVELTKTAIRVPGSGSKRSAECVLPVGSSVNTDGDLCSVDRSSFAARNMEMDTDVLDVGVGVTCVTKLSETSGVPGYESERSAKFVLPACSSDNTDGALCGNVLCSIAAPEAESDEEVLGLVEVQERLFLVDESCSLYVSNASVHRKINLPHGLFNGAAVTSYVSISPSRGVFDLCLNVMCSITATQVESDKEVLSFGNEFISLYASIASVRREVEVYDPVGVFNGVAAASSMSISPLWGVGLCVVDPCSNIALHYFMFLFSSDLSFNFIGEV